jgi:2-polyprenyl-3-methyl-5-hydroxy-6-metoxy-1,4-benzoquinol methylase
MTSPLDEHEAEILRSWHTNARPWSEAIRSESIASRKLVTNRAILDAMSAVEASRVLDVGCGEGWLSRELSARGLKVLGIDAVSELIQEAQNLGGGDFQVLDYSAIASRAWRAGPFDAAVCNFSLLGGESVDQLISGLRGYLADTGYLVIQTLHPIAACGNEAYTDGWRRGNWCGFSDDFSDPAPWFFRTIETWESLLKYGGFELVERREPRGLPAAMPSSIIWICKARGAAQT